MAYPGLWGGHDQGVVGDPLQQECAEQSWTLDLGAAGLLTWSLNLGQGWPSLLQLVYREEETNLIKTQIRKGFK